MRRHWVVLLAALACVAVVALPATAAKKPAKKYERFTALIGKEEAPSAGDPDGYGAADLTITGNKVCFRIIAKDIDRVFAAHIHKAAPGEAGPVVVDLYSAKGKSQELPPRISGCAKTTTAIAKDIAKNFDDYYVNVHNEPFPNGALRGQLSN
jgi:hypothetical protein